MRDWDDLVVVGRIARPHGLRGHVVVNPETDFPEDRFRPAAELWLSRGGRPERVTVAEARLHQRRPVVRFEGIESVEQAEALGRGELRADPAGFAALPEGTFRHADLVGCAVVTTQGAGVGTVVRVDGEMARSRLVVAGAGREMMVPLAETICVAIDTVARRIVVDPPEGLLDL